MSSPLTKATEFLGSIKSVCHRVPWVKCMLLSKAFPFVCVFDETLGDLRHLNLSHSPLEPNALLLALRCRPRCSLALLNSPCCYLSATLNVSWSRWNVRVLYAECRTLGAEGAGAAHGLIISCPRSPSRRLEIGSKCALQPIPSLHGY